jgi:epoxyqueuosine reductase
VVCADQIEAELPPAAGGEGGGHGPGPGLRQSRLLTPDALKRRLIARAAAEGFAVARVTTPDAIPEAAARLAQWLSDGHHGEMGWMEERAEWRANPAALWAEAKSVIMLGLSYAPGHDPLEALARRDRAVLSVYAARRDYHDVLKGKLKTIAGELARAQAGVKVFVDTAPVMEKPLAAAAGLGWQGKHTVLVSRTQGSWLFLGAIFTTAILPPDAPETDHCGRCTRCLDICPTQAFPAPYVLDARRCIAYLTIEHDGPIEPAFREAIGNRVFGCDDCLAVCPWNKFAGEARETRMALREDLLALPLTTLAALDDAGFRALFAGTPIKRTGRDRFVRNVLIALGNAGEAALAPAAAARLDDASPLVRGMAVWALSRLDPARLALRALTHRPGETDPHVQAEWALALGETSA